MDNIIDHIKESSIWEIKCDKCGKTEYSNDASIYNAEKIFKMLGWRNLDEYSLCMNCYNHYMNKKCIKCQSTYGSLHCDNCLYNESEYNTQPQDNFLEKR